MDRQFHYGSRTTSILEDIFYGYNMSNADTEEESSSSSYTPRERTRKVTLTEITDEFDEVFDNNDIPEEVNAEEAFLALEEEVKQWKTRLEQTVGDGLRKLKRNIKDQRLAVKYIPGAHSGRDELGILNEAKLLAIKSCELENRKIMMGLSKHVQRIFNIGNVIQPPKVGMGANDNKKKLINISCAAGGGLDNFKELLKSIGSLPDSSAAPLWSFKSNTIPIYSPNCDQRDKYALVKKGCTDILPAYKRWFHCDLPPVMNAKECPKRTPMLPVNYKEDFKIKHYQVEGTPRKRAIKRPIPKAKQTKQKLNKRYEMREFVTKSGVTKIFISKRNERTISLHDSEDIYSDWLKLVEGSSGSPKARPPSPPKPSVLGPFLYSEILKRNLTLPPEAPEDIYESWRTLLIAEEEKELIDGSIKRSAQGMEPEDFFQSWKHNLNSSLAGYEPIPFIHEKIFRSWRRNLFEPRAANPSSTQIDSTVPENYFCDWLHNLSVSEQASKINRGNSKRQSRRKRSGKKDR